MIDLWGKQCQCRALRFTKLQYFLPPGERIFRSQPLFAQGMEQSFVFCKRGRHAEGSIDHFDEISFFAQDELPVLREGKVLASLRVRSQTCLVTLISSQAVEGNQAPTHVVCAFIRKEIADKMAAAAGNNAAPVLGVFLKIVPLIWVDLIANDADNGHGCSFPFSLSRCITSRQSHTHSGNRSYGFAAGYRHAGSMRIAVHEYFAYDQTMDVRDRGNVGDYGDAAASKVAAAIGEPARARMLYCLMDGHARTGTE